MEKQRKADYVRRMIRTQPADGHKCHWPGCETVCKPAQWGCLKHWRKLPKHLRDKIWATFKPGQEVSKTPTRAYIEVAREVQAWIAENAGPTATS
jgi:hypothetical protein